MLFAEVLQKLPDSLPLILGDALHCMRSSLDQITYALSIAHTPDLPAEQQRIPAFPMGKGARARDRIRFTSPAACADLMDLAPDQERQPLDEDLLWLLDNVENRDKHREVLVTTDIFGVSYELRASRGSDFFRTFETSPKIGAGRVRVCEYSIGPDVHAQVTPAVQAVFDQGTELAHREVTPTLRSIHDHIRNVVFQRLEAHL